MTPEQRYTKARSIPPSEWDKLRDYPVELNNIRFYDGEIRIDTQHGGEILISPDDVDANTVEKLVIESFIDHYAPEVELVWEKMIDCDGTYFFSNKLISIAVWQENYWRYLVSHLGKAINSKQPFKSNSEAISAATAVARELIKSVIKKP